MTVRSICTACASLLMLTGCSSNQTEESVNTSIEGTVASVGDDNVWIDISDQQDDRICITESSEIIIIEDYSTISLSDLETDDRVRLMYTDGKLSIIEAYTESE